jgi:hypothetical protein
MKFFFPILFWLWPVFAFTQAEDSLPKATSKKHLFSPFKKYIRRITNPKSLPVVL